MIRKIRGVSSDQLDALMKTLEAYEARHPRAEIEGYLEDSFSIKLRIVDPDFQGVSRTDRHNAIWRELETLPEETLSYLSILLLLTPEERKTSFASLEFDDPAPSTLD
jgi:stress-induced morphogen